MPRAPFAIMIAMTSFLAIPASHAWAQESATDATTPIDKRVGNLQPPTDNTLSNDEVKQLEAEQHMPATQPATAGTAATDAPVPSVSGTTPSYKEKGGSAAQSEGQ